jgi:hypothetical protein
VDRAGAFRDPDFAAVAAQNFGGKVGHCVMFLHEAKEFGAPAAIRVKEVANVAYARYELGWGLVTINAGQRGIDIQITPVRSGLKNPFTGILEHAAKAVFGLL